MNTIPMSVIADFVDHYERHDLAELYEPAAAHVEKILRLALLDANIKAVVTARAKSPRSLKDKLYQKYPNSPPSSFEQVKQETKDLTGARIAVYFPSDRWEVEAIIYKTFVHVEQVSHPTPSELQEISSAKRFDGYSAEHYIVSFDPDGWTEVSTPPWSSIRVEVQVASTLVHAWAEVDHDIVYKAPKQINADSLALLDAVNGLVLSGEILFDSLKHTLISRGHINGPKPRFVLGDMLKRAESDLWIFGQTLYNLLSDGNETHSICEALRNQPALKIHMLIPDLRLKSVKDDVTYGWPEFESHHREAVKLLKDLIRRVEQQGRGRLYGYLSGHLKRETLFIADPEAVDSSLFALVLLRILPGVASQHRVPVWIEKNKHPNRFHELWSRYKEIENGATNLTTLPTI